MAEALVAGAVLSAVFDVLFKKMASKEVVDFCKQRKLDDEVLQKLRRRMNTISGLLEDAEEKQITKQAVRNWLDDLKDVAYEVDDLLDEMAYKAREQQELEAGPYTCSDQVRNFFSSLNPCKMGMGELEPRLEKILTRVEELLDQKDSLSLDKLDGVKPYPLSSRGRLPTTSLVYESGVYGRDHDKEAIVKLLLSDDEDLGVIPIVGMGGVGKTTMSQLVYNDSRVKQRFDKLKAWVCVSHDFDVLKLTKNILKEIDSSDCDSKSPNALQLELEEKVRGERILLVLDDIWNDNHAEWEFLLTPLKSAARGSKVLVTTREERIASVMSTVPSYHLKELSEDDCWLLFAKYALESCDSDTHTDLEQIGREIVKRCKGLPLAAKAIGNLLRSERRIEKWEKIIRSNMWWDMNDDTIIPALRLSYHYLPSHLKRCFAYCAVFPKDCQFRKKALVLLWMAEGFIVQHSNKREEMEEIGEEYFEDLLSRSFFQKHGSKEDVFVMHDLMNDLAKSIAREFCYNHVDDASSGQLTERTRHLYYRGGNRSNALDELKGLSKAQSLRTLFMYSNSRVEGTQVVNNLLPRLKRLRVLHLYIYDEDETDISDLVNNFKHLRCLQLHFMSIPRLSENIHTLSCLQILIIRGCWRLVTLPDSIGQLKDLRHLNLHSTSIRWLPESIGNLKNLRHLDLGETAIERLPNSICGLQSLQHLSLKGCQELVELPAKMMDLDNLCHLDIRGTKLKSMPLQMSKLLKLQTLPVFFVGKDQGSSIAELGELLHLQGPLFLQNLQNIADAQDAMEAKIKDKTRLEELQYIWEDDHYNTGTTHDTDSVDIKLLHYLQPHLNVRTIRIQGYRGTNFPNWIGDSSFSNIVRVYLSNCKYCTCLPPLGQLTFLQDLHVQGFDSVVSVGAEFYGSSYAIHPFRSLESLIFTRMPQWKEWTSSGNETEADGTFRAFPVLRHLTIADCPELKPLRKGMLPSSLQQLKIQGCNKIISVRMDMDLHKLSFLSHFDLGSVQDMQSFPGKILLPSGLSSISISNLQNLKSLDYSGIQHLTSLTSLSISDCPNLGCIPEEGLPLSLGEISICRCHLLEERCRREQGEDWPKISHIPKKFINYRKII